MYKWWYVIFVQLANGSDGKASDYNAGDPGSIPGSGRPPGEGNGNPLQYSCLENPMDGEAWWAIVHGVTKSRTRLSDLTLTSSKDTSSKQKINRETQTLCGTLHLMNLIGIYRAFHPKIAGYTFFSSAHERFSRIDHMLGHKVSFG